ncbi:E3 ubiquitin-protein ligase RBBP6-like [Taeniopygia guttata]|uniref:E3 ubiquitin-protein ligase RBBP6-like n=1 Tax=Taeniopygia guttata TaxID=59729 RepID=UPI003BB8FD20
MKTWSLHQKGQLRKTWGLPQCHHHGVPCLCSSCAEDNDSPLEQSSGGSTAPGHHTTRSQCSGWVPRACGSVVWQLVAAPWLCPACPGQHSEAEVPQPGQGWDCRAMSVVHYKFSSKLSYDVVTFHGHSISVGDLKRQIMARERLKAANSDLRIFKAETSEEYSDDAQIPKNVSVIVKRVPARAVAPKLHQPIGKASRNQNEPVRETSKAISDSSASLSLAQLIKTPNLAEANASEEDKIKAMMVQSCRYYEPLNDLKTPLGPVPSSPTSPVPRLKRSSGIPMSFMVEVKDPSTKGAMLTPSGKYAIPIINLRQHPQPESSAGMEPPVKKVKKAEKPV